MVLPLPRLGASQVWHGTTQLHHEMHQHSFPITNVLPAWLWHNVVFLHCTQDNFVLIERLWRDVWISVSSKYFNLLHSLEEDDLLDISCTDDIFCVHYASLPRLKRDLEIFTEGWNHHPLRTEGNRSPTQIWEIARMLNTNVHTENLAVSVFFVFVFLKKIDKTWDQIY